MKQTRKVLILLMLMVFVAGLGVMLYPNLRGAVVDYEIKQEAVSFLEQVTEENEISEDVDIPATEPVETETVLYPELLEAMRSYNEQIWEEKQMNLCDPWSYEQPSFTLGEYGLEDEIFGVLSIPRLELEMPICATRS